MTRIENFQVDIADNGYKVSVTIVNREAFDNRGYPAVTYQELVFESWPKAKKAIRNFLTEMDEMAREAKERKENAS